MDVGMDMGDTVLGVHEDEGIGLNVEAEAFCASVDISLPLEATL